MNIKYYKDNRKTIGVAVYNNKYWDPAPEVDPLVASMVIENATSTEIKQLTNKCTLKSHANAAECDEYNEEKGKNIVRDKLIIKDCERNIKKYEIIKKYLLKELDNIDRVMKNSNDRMNKAYERLEN